MEAAGGVLWRPSQRASQDATEVALVHRPKYDDWSLPKGKLEPGEHPLLAALREVEEETGFSGMPGRYLAETRYAKDGGDKRVRYWAVRGTGGAFVPNREVDQVVWLPVADAAQVLAADHDRPVLARFGTDTASTRPCLLLRHASAGSRAAWTGADWDRELDERGWEQARALAPLLTAYGVKRVLSANVRRCLDTVAPFAREHQLTVEAEPLVSESGFERHPDAARARFLEVVRTADGGTVVCSQGGVVDDLVAHACAALGEVPPADTSARKSGMWVLHLAPSVDAHGRADVRLAGLERFGATI